MLYLFPRVPSILDTDFCTEQGQVIYRVLASTKWNAKTISISKVVPNESPEDLRDRFEEIGKIEFPRLRTAVITFSGSQPTSSSTKATDYFKRSGWPKITDLRFEGVDGKAYRWVLNSYGVKVIMDDTETTSTPSAPSPSMQTSAPPIISEFPHYPSTPSATTETTSPEAVRMPEQRTSLLINVPNPTSVELEVAPPVELKADGEVEGGRPEHAGKERTPTTDQVQTWQKLKSNLTDQIFLTFIYTETARRAQEPKFGGPDIQTSWLYTPLR